MKHLDSIILLGAIVVAAVVLGGCSFSIEDAERVGEEYVAEKAKYNDAKLRGFEAGLCRGVSVGAWVRQYGNDETKAEAWRQLCQESYEETP